jgi:hypothetical protein
MLLSLVSFLTGSVDETARTNDYRIELVKPTLEKGSRLTIRASGPGVVVVRIVGLERESLPDVLFARFVARSAAAGEFFATPTFGENRETTYTIEVVAPSAPGRYTLITAPSSFATHLTGAPPANRYPRFEVIVK